MMADKPWQQPGFAISASTMSPRTTAHDCQQSPQAACNASRPTEAAPAANSSIDDDIGACSKIACRQVRSSIRAADAALAWAEAKTRMLQCQPRSRRAAALLKQSKCHRNELEAYLRTLNHGLRNCQEQVVSMDSVCPSELVTRLLLIGEAPTLEHEDDAAWQAARVHLQTDPGVDSRDLAIMDGLQVEMGFIKSAKCHVHDTLAVLEEFDRDMGKLASNLVSSQKPPPAAEACQSAGCESKLRRATAAAAAAVLPDEADKAAIQQKVAKNSKKQLPGKLPLPRSSKPAQKPDSGANLPAG